MRKTITLLVALLFSSTGAINVAAQNWEQGNGDNDFGAYEKEEEKPNWDGMCYKVTNKQQLTAPSGEFVIGSAELTSAGEWKVMCEFEYSTVMKTSWGPGIEQFGAYNCLSMADGMINPEEEIRGDGNAKSFPTRLSLEVVNANNNQFRIVSEQYGKLYVGDIRVTYSNGSQEVKYNKLVGNQMKNAVSNSSDNYVWTIDLQKDGSFIIKSERNGKTYYLMYSDVSAFCAVSQEEYEKGQNSDIKKAYSDWNGGYHTSNTITGSLTPVAIYIRTFQGKGYFNVALQDKDENGNDIEGMGWGTYFIDYPYIMPEGVTGYVLREKDLVESENDLYTKTFDLSDTNDNRFEPGDIVPANTALLLYGTCGIHQYDFSINTQTGEYEDGDFQSGNLLRGTLVDRKPITIGQTYNETNVIYNGGKLFKLTKGRSGQWKDMPGFYFEANCSDGSFVKQNSHKCYLYLPESIDASSISFNFNGQATGINSVTTTKAAAGIYNLSGVRINGTADQLPKGFYIINGKKVIVK